MLDYDLLHPNKYVPTIKTFDLCEQSKKVEGLGKSTTYCGFLVFFK